MLPSFTSRLVLRDFTPDDAPFMLGLVNEPAYVRFIADRGIRTTEDAAAYLRAGPMASYSASGASSRLRTRKTIHRWACSGSSASPRLAPSLRRDTMSQPVSSRRICLPHSWRLRRHLYLDNNR